MTSPIIKDICNEFLNSPSSPNVFIEPFFDNENIIEKTSNVSMEIGKTFTLEKECVWKPPKGEDCNIHNNGCFVINRINDKIILANRYSLDKYCDISTLYICWTSKDGLTFDDTKHTLLPYHRDNHDPYFHVHEDQENKFIGIFRGRAHYNRELKDFQENTGLHYHKFINNEFDLNVKPIIVGKDTNKNPKDNFDSLNSINFHKDKFYSHVRINKVSEWSKDDCSWLGNNFINRGVQLIIHDKFQQKIEQGIQVCRYWDSNKPNKKEIFEKDIYLPCVFNYKHTEYNLAIPNFCNHFFHDSLITKKSVETKFFFPGGLFITKKNCQLHFHKIFDTNFIFNKEDNKLTHPVPGMIESNDHTKYFIYYLIWFTQTEDKSWDDICNKRIECYSIEKDRFYCLSCNEDNEGFVKIKLKQNFKNMFINFETFENGYIICQLKDKDNNSIYTTNKLIGNHLEYNTLFDLSERTNTDYIQFTLYKTKLYSYKLL